MKQTFNKWIKWMLLAGIACCASIATAQVLTQNFDGFDDYDDNPPPAPQTDVNGWTINEVIIYEASALGSTAKDGAKIAFLPDNVEGYSGVSGANSYVETPLLSNGVGTVRFHLNNFTQFSGAGPFRCEVRLSTNDTDWVSVATFTNHTTDAWTEHVLTLDHYQPARLRFYKGALTTDGSWVELDAITIDPPPARVLIEDIQIAPVDPFADQAVSLDAKLLPSTLATIDDVKLLWTTGSGTNEIAMAYNEISERYETTDSIPGQAATVTVNYTVRVTFQGPAALSPATASGSYTVGVRFAVSDYDPMQVVGTINGAMELIADYTWQTVITTGTDLAPATFDFAGTPTNNPAVTNRWGDDAQAQGAILPFADTANSDGAAISIDTLPAGQTLIRFNEATLAYRVAPSVFQPVHTWTGAGTVGTHTDNGWVAVNAAVGTPEGPAHRIGVLLEADGNASLRSPELPDGIGEISFWYRHAETGSVDFAEALIQVSDAPDSGWITMTNIPAIQVTVFNRFTMTMNDRQNRYVRILNTDGARLALDDIAVSYAGAGVVLTNLTHLPALPGASDPVHIQVHTELRNGASDLELTAYYRTGSSGPFTPLAMTNANGVYTTATPVPAGQGDDLDGTGTVDYYVAAIFDGFEAAFGTPTEHPFGGGDNPASFTVQPSRVHISNDAVDPTPVPVNTAAHVEVDIQSHYGATVTSATLHYRIGGAGAFLNTIPMQLDTAPHTYRTTAPIPGQPEPGTAVQYFITVAFSGAAPLSPTNYPVGGSADPRSFITRAAPPEGIYTGMTVEGDITASLAMVRDGEWSGVAPVGSLTDRQIRFVAQNGGTITWRDPEQPRTELPIFSTAATGGVDDDIRIDFTEPEYLAFGFHESNQRYSIQQADYQSFDDWAASGSFGTHTNAGWILTRGRTTDDPELAFDGRSAQFESTTALRAIESPELTNGIGTISFRYRNTETGGVAPAELVIQVWHDQLSTWQTEHTITNIISADYLYASATISSLNRKRVRIAVPAGTPAVQLLIDDVVVTRPGATLVFSNLTHSPSSPTILDTVDVSLTITQLNGAADLDAILYYRAAESPVWDTAPMTGTTHVASSIPIPRGPAAAMEYYVRASYLDPATGERNTAYEPELGSPATYTNTDLLAAWQNFGAFTDYNENPPPAPQTDVNGWTINEVIIFTAAALGMEAKDGQKIAFLPDSAYPDGSSGVTGTNSYVETPLLSNGVGSVTFHLRNFTLMGGAGPFRCDVRLSINDTDWVSVATFTNHTTETWTKHALKLDYYQPVRLRFYKGALTTDGSWVELDAISITYPPAYVTTGDLMIHPAYPSQSDTVEITSHIESATTFHPAFNIAGGIYYRKVGAPAWQGPIPMTRNGNAFRTEYGIPAHVVTDEVEYYLAASFKGYSAPGANKSPMTFYPDRPDGQPYDYQVRRHASDFSKLEVSINGDAQSFRQTHNNIWESILDFRTPVTDAGIIVSGYDFYDGTNVMDGLSTAWGDPDQDRPALPYVGVMQPGAPPLILDGTYSGQFLLRFNEADRSYILLRAAWQPFDNWLASAQFFEAGHSADSAGIIKQPFTPALWPASAYTTTLPNEFRSDDFEGDIGFMSAYAYQYPLASSFDWASASPDSYQYTASGIGVQRGIVITQRVGRAVMLRPAAGTGRMRTSPTPMLGVGTVSFDARAVDGSLKTNLHGYSNNADRENLMFEARTGASAIADSLEDITLGHSYLAMVARYQNADNYYELRLAQIDAAQYQIQLWSVKGGTREWVNGQFRPGSITTARTYRLILSTYAHSGTRVHYQLYEDGNHRFTGDDTVSRTVSGHGQVGFQALDAGMIVDDVVVGNANIQRTRGWPTTQNFTTIREHDGWMSRYCHIQSASPDEGFRMRAYDPLFDSAFLRSPKMADGLGTIRFGYRRQGGAAGRLLLQYSTVNTTDDNLWTTFHPIDVTSQTWNDNFSINANIDTANVYFRIVNTHLGAATPSRVDVRNIVIEPNRVQTYRELFNAAPAGWSNPVWTWNSTHNDYRVAGYTAAPLSLSIDFSLTDDEGSFSSIATFTGIGNTAYQRLSHNVHQAANGFIRIRHTAGNASLIIDNLDITPWRARDATDTNGWSMAKGWVTSYAPDARQHAVAMTRSRARATDPQFIRGPWMTNGVGHVEFEYLTSGSGPFELKLQTTPLFSPTEVDWDTVAVITTLAPDWRRFGHAVNQDGNLRVRLLHTSSSGDRTVAVDNLELRDFIDVDDLSWVAYNALITDTPTKPIFIDEYSEPDKMKSGFLNRGPGIYADTPTNLTAHLPFIESPYLADGIGQIRFWYNRAEGSTPAILHLKSAPSRETPDANWSLLGTISNINHAAYARFDETFFVRDHHFVRIYNDTNTSSRVGLDNILITAPFGATVSVRDLTLDPAIPLIGETVHVEATVTNFFLSPSNITMRTYWRTGTNDWGSITGMAAIPMHVTAEGPGYRRFRTDVPIPAHTAEVIESVVQYLVSTEFEGLFSDKSSPYHYRTFTNPAWYEPVNLNTGKANPIPYYYSFVSLPGHVWINEINVNNSWEAEGTWAGGIDPPQYIEIAGRSGINIGNWRIKIYNDNNYGLTGNYAIAPDTQLANVTNNYGFYVLGDSNLSAPPRNQLLTTGIPSPGGIQLIRAMGAIAHAVAFDAEGTGAANMMTDPSYQFIYIGADDDFLGPNSPLAATGTGSNLTNFAAIENWSNNTSYTPGGINAAQVLVLWEPDNGDDPDDPDGPPLAIRAFWLDMNAVPPRITFTVQGNTNSYIPRPFYSTNLLSGTWSEAPNANHSRDGNTYTVWGDLMTGPNGVFYRIEDTAP